MMVLIPAASSVVARDLPVEFPSSVGARLPVTVLLVLKCLPGPPRLRFSHLEVRVNAAGPGGRLSESDPGRGGLPVPGIWILGRL
jgi:hypothetical protein